MARAVVPIDADFLRTAAEAREPEEEPMMRAVEMPCGKRQLAEFSSHRSFVKRAIVTFERAALAVEIIADSIRREFAVLKGARDALAHQRIDARGVAGQDDAAARVAIAGVEPSNRERMPSRRVALEPIQRKLGKRGQQLIDHLRLFTAAGEFARTLIVDAQIEVRSTIDQARK